MSQQPKPENSGNTSCSSDGEEQRLTLSEVQQVIQDVSRTAITAKYPQMNGLANQEATALVVTEFLEWLETKGYKVCETTPHAGLQPVLIPIDAFVSRFLGIDHAELQRERKSLLQTVISNLSAARVPTGELKGLPSVPGGCRTGRCPPRRQLGTVFVSPQILKDLEGFNDRDPSNPTDGSPPQQEAVQEADHPPGTTQGET